MRHCSHAQQRAVSCEKRQTRGCTAAHQSRWTYSRIGGAVHERREKSHTQHSLELVYTRRAYTRCCSHSEHVEFVCYKAGKCDEVLLDWMQKLLGSY